MVSVEHEMTTFSIVNGKVISDNTGTSQLMRVLTWSDGELRPLIDYCLVTQRSSSWQEKLLRAVKLFLEYLEANSIPGLDEVQLFRNFSNALARGTIDLKTREDSSGLYWIPVRALQRNYMIRQLSDFFDWLGPDKGQLPLPNVTLSRKFNPRYTANIYDARIDRQAYLYRRSKAFLGHAWSKESKNDSRRVRGERVSKVFPSRPPMFPEERFEELLFKGFKVAGQYDYRGMLITLMQFGGGLRVSEPFHLYMADVQPYWDDLEKAFVVVHHPSLGNAPNHWKNGPGQTRIETRIFSRRIWFGATS